MFYMIEYINKFRTLTKTTTVPVKTAYIIQNHSSQSFSNEEIKYRNNGLKCVSEQGKILEKVVLKTQSNIYQNLQKDTGTNYKSTIYI